MILKTFFLYNIIYIYKMPKKYNTSRPYRSRTPVRNHKNYRHKYESNKYYDSDTESSNSSSTEEYTSTDSSDSEDEYDKKFRRNNKKLKEKKDVSREHLRDYSRQERPSDLKKVDKNSKKNTIDRDEKYMSRRSEKDSKKKSQKYDIENEYEDDNYEVSGIKKEESDYEEENEKQYKNEKKKKNIKNENEELEADVKTNGTPKYRVVSFNGEELTVRKMYTSNIGPKNAAQKAFNRMCDRLNEKMEITVEKAGDNKGKIMTYFFMKQELDQPIEKTIGGKKVIYRHKTVSC